MNIPWKPSTTPGVIGIIAFVFDVAFLFAACEIGRIRERHFPYNAAKVVVWLVETMSLANTLQGTKSLNFMLAHRDRSQSRGSNVLTSNTTKWVKTFLCLAWFGSPFSLSKCAKSENVSQKMLISSPRATMSPIFGKQHASWIKTLKLCTGLSFWIQGGVLVAFVLSKTIAGFFKKKSNGDVNI